MKEFNITLVPTNNPKIIKLEANHFLVKGNYEYKNIDEAKDSPLAQQLFYLPFVKTVYIASNFVALERFDIVEWDDVKDEVAQQLVEYLNAGEPIVNEVDVKKKAAHNGLCRGNAQPRGDEIRLQQENCSQHLRVQEHR